MYDVSGPPPKSPRSDTSDFSSLNSCAVASGRNSDITSSGSTTRRSSCETTASLSHATLKSMPRRKSYKDEDLAWNAIHSLRLQGEEINMTSLKVMCKLGQGDSGSVYLTQLRGTSCLFALKVVDKEKLMKKNKLHRLHIEREVLELVDHPFLPTLYAHFDTGKLSCLLMEYCPGGDLHALIHRQSRHHLPMKMVRFYAAQVVVALEYLHMKGIVYRDLKPENVLLRANGHIMLSDFDLCAYAHESPRIVKLPITTISSRSKRRLLQRYLKAQYYPTKIAKSTWIQALWSYLKSSWIQKKTSLRKSGMQITKTKCGLMYTELVVEPLSLRTRSFVGTHEYLAPEVLGGLGHGSSVDWWMLGILIYELVYGVTPFKGYNDKHTLYNIRMQRLRFPSEPDIMEVGDACKSLLRGLLSKEPSRRLGSHGGALEIKQHPFFKGVNWALVRTSKPPLFRAGAEPRHQHLTIQPLEYF